MKRYIMVVFTNEGINHICFPLGQSSLYLIWGNKCSFVDPKELVFNVVIIPKVYLVPEAKPRDTNIPRVLLLLVNDSPNLLVPKAKPRNTNNIFYYYFYSANVPNHLLMTNNHPMLYVSIHSHKNIKFRDWTINSVCNMSFFYQKTIFY